MKRPEKHQEHNKDHHKEHGCFCFLAGTRIATPAGESTIETLAAGDLVLTANGGETPIRWLGHTTYSRRRADPMSVFPIRIRAGALGENLPRRDLHVSPGHALLIGDVLVQAGALANGASVARHPAVPETFTYYHIETDNHDLLLAEGVPAESFLDGAEEIRFDNAAERPPRAGAPEEMRYPRVKTARQLPAWLRTLLVARAAAIAPPVAAVA